jgi:hypothetical protein
LVVSVTYQKPSPERWPHNIDLHQPPVRSDFLLLIFIVRIVRVSQC